MHGAKCCILTQQYIGIVYLFKTRADMQRTVAVSQKENNPKAVHEHLDILVHDR